MKARPNTWPALRLLLVLGRLNAARACYVRFWPLPDISGIRMKIFLAGAGGAIGRRLTTLLRGAGHTVVGTTRSKDKTAALAELGAEPVVVDVFDIKERARGESGCTRCADAPAHRSSLRARDATLR